MKEQDSQKYDILLIEDNPGDIRLSQELLKDNRYVNNTYIVTDGEAAIRFLKKIEPYVDAPVPHLIILDLNLPRLNGLDVLKEIKEDKELRYIPVIVLTTSQAESDVIKSYEMKANCYIVKSVEFEEFAKQFSTMLEFWLRLARIPRHIEKKL